MVGLFVSDMRAMVTFYRDVLHIEVDWDGQEPYAECKVEGTRLSFYERKLLPGLLGTDVAYPSGINGSFELAFDFPTSAALDAEFARVTAAGARALYPPRDEPWGMRSCYVLDPDGNLIELTSWNKGA
jgi:catechol 2,3-dioxygenase-like lactoylglutathione lyase family enzyme